MKNKEQKLSELISKIKELLPRLMKLEKGCLVKVYDIDYLVEIIKTNETNYDKYWECLIDNEIVFLERCTNIEKIIGKEPTILDALECLKTSHTNKTSCYSLLDNGRLTFEDVNQGELKACCDIDLSNPLIKDLDSETINFLHSVLCKK